MPNPNRSPRVQFRLDNETFGLIEERVAELAQQETKTTPDAYCRALVLAALGQPANIAFADEIAINAYAARHRIAQFIGQLIEANMEAIVQAANHPSSEDE